MSWSLIPNGKTFFWFNLLLWIVFSQAATSVSAQQASTSESSLTTTFLRRYCIECHGPNKQSGERRFDMLDQEIHTDDALIDWQDILDQLNLGDMPPPDAMQPPVAIRLEAIQVLTSKIEHYHSTREPRRGEVVLRRLNAHEYQNAVRDLLHLNLTIFDPTEKFPRDQQFEHLDNVGEALVMSGHLLAEYLESANAIVNKSVYPLEKPDIQT